MSDSGNKGSYIICFKKSEYKYITISVDRQRDPHIHVNRLEVFNEEQIDENGSIKG
jgi:hypothetical protein